MGYFFEGYNLLTIGSFLALLILLIICNELTRRSKTLSIFAYILLPIIVFTLCVPLKLMGSPSGQTWFGWVKTGSALIGVLGFMAIRYTNLKHKKIACYFPAAILIINIIEAIYREYEVYHTYAVPLVDEAGLYLQGGVWNILNGFAGVFLLLSLTGWVGIQVANTKSQDLIWPDQLWFWILAYDFWNITYCYNSVSTRAAYAGVLIIIACTLCEIFLKRGAWLQHRAQTLALFGMFSLAVDYQQYECFSIVSSYNPNALTALALLSLLTNLLVFLYEIRTIRKYRRNPLKADMYVHKDGYQKNLQANNLVQKA